MKIYLFSIKKPPRASLLSGANHRRLSAGGADFFNITQGLNNMKLINAGKCLIEAQKINGINSRKLATMANTTPQQVLRWRKSKNLKIHTIQTLSLVLGITVAEFITLSSN